MALSTPNYYLKNLTPLSSKSIFDNGHDRIIIRRRRRTAPAVNLRITPASNTGGSGELVYEEGQLGRPRWTGETPLSRLVGALISFKPLFSVLKLGARQVLIRSILSLSISLHIYVCIYRHYKLLL